MIRLRFRFRFQLCDGLLRFVDERYASGAACFVQKELVKKALVKVWGGY